MVQVINVHATFIKSTIHGSMLTMKVVRNLMDLKVLVYKFSRLSLHLDVLPDNFEQDPLDEYGAWSLTTEA